MPVVSKSERLVTVVYELHCGFERATALADDLCRILKDDAGFLEAKDDTRGWDGDRLSVVDVEYATLADAVRLDAQVRRLLSRKVDFTYRAESGTGYNRHGGFLTVTSYTTLQEVA